jgi:hypothetical protein
VEQPIFTSISSGFEVFDNVYGDSTRTTLFLMKVDNFPPELSVDNTYGMEGMRLRTFTLD